MLILALTFSPAHAQTWTDEASGVLVAQPGITANGVGSPSVVWDPDDERYVMFFESRTGAATAGNCPAGTWSIGIASSDDGLDWDVWPNAVVAPTAGTPWRCVAAHPTAVYDNGTYHLWFKAEQGVVAAGCGNAWGCNNYSGISHATVDVNLDDKTTEIAIVQAEIDAHDAASPPMDSFLDALEEYEADLLASNEFACADDVPGICAPCTAFDLVTTKAAPPNHDFCQPFQFAIPSTVDVVNGGAGNNIITLIVTPTVGSTYNCIYRKKGATYRLDNTSGGTADGLCANGLAQGTPITVSNLRFTVAGGSGNNPTVTAPLIAINAGSQTFSSTLIDSFDDVEAAIVADDESEVFALLPDFVADLQALVAWLAPYTPLDAGKTTLETDGAALVTQATNLEADLDAWDAEYQILLDELQELEDYTQSVNVVGLLNQVGVQINRTFGFPAAMKKGTSWVLMFQDYPNIWRATSNSPDGPFTVDAAPVASAGTVSWAMTEAYEPNLMCTGDALPAPPYQMYFGGRTVTAGTFTSGGISDGFSTDAASWALNVASQLFGWTDVNDFRHFDVVRASDGEYRMWYTDRVGGVPQVNVASTGAYDDTLTTQRVCP